MKYYKKKYEQALSNFKKIKAANKDNKELIDFIEYNYPELKESEDGRVRKALIELVRMVDKNPIGQIFGYGDIKYSDMIAWIEKQGSISKKNEKLRQYREYLIKETERWHKKEEDETLSKIGRQDCIGHANAYVSARSEFEDLFNYDYWFEKQDEQKQDVIIPKFNYDDVLALQCCMETIKKSQEDKELYEQLQNLHDRVHDAYWLEKQCEQKLQSKSILEVWKDMRLEVYQQASGNRHEPNYSDDNTKMFSLTDIDEIFEKIAEKKDEQKSADKVEPKFKVGDTIVEKDFDEIGCGTIVNIKDGKYIFDDGCYIEIKEQGLWQLVEQKPTEKVEPKFKVGDWVVWDDKISCHIDNLYQGKESLMYTITDVHNMTRSYGVKDFDNNAHLWTIQDAKDGDVLLSPATSEGDKECPFIFKELDEDGVVRYHAALLQSEYFKIADGITNVIGYANVGYHIPATKEQYDLLLSKMKEAGYELDVKKKELKKIEQKSKEKPKFYDSMDDLIADALIEEIEGSDLDDSSKHNRIFWIESHRQKPTWGEEDEEMFDAIIADIQFTQKVHTHDTNQVVYEREIDWLKSLKERLGGK